MEIEPQPMSTVRHAASSRLQIRSSTTPSTRHSLKCYTINARSRGNRSVSVQVEGGSQPAAAAPRDDELPEELRRGNALDTLKPLSKLSLCETIGNHKAYAFTPFGKIIAEQALPYEPTYGTHGDTFREGRHGLFYLLRIVKTSSSKVATAVEMLLDHAGPARSCLCKLFAGAVSDAPWAAQGKVAVCSLVPYGKECSEDGDAYFAVHKSNCRSASYHGLTPSTRRQFDG